MAITFDQLLQTIIGTIEPEAGFNIQGDAHRVGALVLDWKEDNLTNGNMITILNFDGADSELATVKTHLNGLNKADTLALEAALILAQSSESSITSIYTKTELRTRFGL